MHGAHLLDVSLQCWQSEAPRLAGHHKHEASQVSRAVGLIKNGRAVSKQHQVAETQAKGSSGGTGSPVPIV